jgi:hypothetical protein
MVNAQSGVLNAANIELNTQWAKYHCGKDGSTGHGFAAEDANAWHDKFAFKNVDDVGRSNEADGADRIVDGCSIQTKYCATPKSTVNAAFADNGTGTYRYYADGRPQILEVPSDQYDMCVEIMRDKILSGKVEGITDPAEATTLVKKGSCTYQQAKNIAKAGNIDSLIFDAKTGCIVALGAFGISFCVKLAISATSCKSVDDVKVAIQLAFLDGLKNGTITLTSSILSTQVLKTTFGRNISAVMTHMSKSGVNSVYQYEVGKKLVHDIASGVFAKQLTGASAKNVVTKIIRVNALTNTFLLAVTSVPDTYRYFVSKSISGPQFTKNLVVNTASISGATVGAILGAKFGKVGAMAGGVIGGMAVGIASKAVADTIHKDDSEAMQELVKIALLELANEHLIHSQSEFDEVVRMIIADKVIDTNLLRVMYAAGADNHDDKVRVDLTKELLEYYFDIQDRRRKTLKLTGQEHLMLESINSIPLALPEGATE